MRGQRRRAHKGVPSKLRAADAFRNTIVKAKDVVRRLINRKIDDFVDLAELEWCVPCRIRSTWARPADRRRRFVARASGSRTPATVSNHASSYLEGATDAAANVIAREGAHRTHMHLPRAAPHQI